MTGWFLLFLSMLSMPQSFQKKLAEFKISESPRILEVNVVDQKLIVHQPGTNDLMFSISTAEKGVGQKANSFQTPLGLHRIREKIGQDAPLGTVFKSREPTGEVWSPAPPSSDKVEPEPVSEKEGQNRLDLITSRILWLEGLEPGVNSGVDSEGVLVDSHERYIYIHGTNHEKNIGKASSCGCVRMKNRDVIQLFDLVQNGDLVWIHNEKSKP